MFQHSLDNDLISPNQSGFKSEDSSKNLLISITNEMYKGFKDGTEEWGVFFDISKAFGKVLHQGLVCKVQCNYISGNILKLLESFLVNRI